MAESVAERAPAQRPEDPFDELRSLLVGPEQRELLELQSEFHDASARTQAVATVLPDALVLKAGDPKLAGAISPMVEGAITASVKRNPQPLVDALFPVMGPAIRKAIQHALASMMESFNRSVEHSISWRALQWRWLAWRTGKPFAEIVLLKTLEYRVEQLYLIHRESGLVLQHVAVADARTQDADQVSAMLTAIRDFARDSFQVGGSDTLEGVHVGDLELLIEQGPHAILAAVVRGTPPASLRSLLQDALESVHRQMPAELKAFRGEASAFDRIRPVLEVCLVAQERERARSAVARPALIIATLVLVALGTWMFFRWRDTQRWTSYVDRLNAEPGITVLFSGRRAGKFFVTGLRDPLARDPVELVRDTQLAADAIDSRWEPYQALRPEFVTARAADLLRPPDGVTLAYRDGVLTASGTAPERWIADGERLAPAIAGVRRFIHAGPDAAEVLRQQLEALEIRFVTAESRIEPDQLDQIGMIKRLLAELDDTLAVRRRRASVVVEGYTDIDGPEALNASLSQRRAEALFDLLSQPALRSIDFTTRAAGVASREQGNAAKQRDRRASLKITLSNAAPGELGR
jgi:OOP family OmpA-OmpF porin